MARRHYRQFFHSGHAGQSAEDVWIANGPLPERLRQGLFTIYWIPSENSAAISGGSRRVIASFAPTGAAQSWSLEYVGGSGVRILGTGITFTPEPITFSTGWELRFDLDGEEGTLTIYRWNPALANPLVLLAEASGDPWSHLADASWNARIGGLIETNGHSARGDVSLPYALKRVVVTGGSDVLSLDGEDVTLDGEQISDP